MKKYRLQVIIEQDEDGYFIAEVPALQGCYTQGKTLEDAMERIKEVITICIEERRNEGKEIEIPHSELIGVKTLEIAV